MRFILKTTLVATSLFALQTITAQIQSPPTIASESTIDSKTYTGILSERYANGSPSLWKTMLKGKPNGLWMEWYPNGTLRYRAYWKNSLGNGKWEYFFPNGQLRSESFYINDIAQGLYKEYHENGQLKTDATYIDGKKDGVEMVYDAGGIPLSRKRYENGQQVLDEPVIFQPGVVSMENANEWGISFMPDGNEAYFTRRDSKTGLKRIYSTTKTKNGWSKPAIAPFSTGEDEGAYITTDGKKMFFASYRPLPDGTTTTAMDMNIWYMERVDGSWSEPIALSSFINKSVIKDDVWPAAYEAGPMTDVNGNLYYWTKGAKGKSTNLFYAPLNSKGNYETPLELFPPSNDAYFDTAPTLSPDGNILFFGSDDRSDGYGGSDIYYCVKSGNGWSSPKNLGPIVNTSKSEGPSGFSPDGKYFYFTSNRGDVKDSYGENYWNIYYMETRFLMIEK